MKTITRSIGLPTGYMGLLCGSGYEGKTKELDDTVKREAELLANAFNRDIEIRFNSDRNSGGAWLVNSLKGFEGNCQVGLNAGLYPKQDEMHALLNQAINKEIDWQVADDKIDKLPKELLVSTYVSASCLKDPSLAKNGTDNDPKCDTKHKSVEDAIAWLKANIDTKKILD